MKLSFSNMIAPPGRVERLRDTAGDGDAQPVGCLAARGGTGLQGRFGLAGIFLEIFWRLAKSGAGDEGSLPSATPPVLDSLGETRCSDERRHHAVSSDWGRRRLKMKVAQTSAPAPRLRPAPWS